MDKEKFNSGTEWKWMPQDSDIWFYEGGQVVQSVEGELTGFSATVNEVTDSSFTITYPSGETQSHNFVDIFFY